MSAIPADLRYVKTHEWLRQESDGSVTVGVTDHAQHLLGDMVFVELPEVDTSLDADAECAVVESVKAASDVYAPIGGRVVEINGAVVDSPELINRDPYGAGWLFRLQPESRGAVDDCLDAERYAALVAEEE
ncbi:glycine cleavage system protein GcvH [Ectothiorhodospiraceae bacterium BW-2]|nr:glycine cleavage system protein GcvH [Ectothiorhodospiraceae bacterium BW-2]